MNVSRYLFGELGRDKLVLEKLHPVLHPSPLPPHVLLRLSELLRHGGQRLPVLAVENRGGNRSRTCSF